MENRLILAIDNSLDEFVIVLSADERIVEEKHIRSKKNTSEIIGSQVMEILDFHGFSVNQLNLIIVTLGPGTFTGIRVGLAFCKGLASGLNIPIVGVSTLDVLGAYFSSFEDYFIFPVIDAKKGEVFYALYVVENASLIRTTDYASKRPQDAVKHIKTPCICFGSGVNLCEPYISDKKETILIKDAFKNISGEQLIKVGLQKAITDERLPLIPVYGRKSEAEIKFNRS